MKVFFIGLGFLGASALHGQVTFYSGASAHADWLTADRIRQWLQRDRWAFDGRDSGTASGILPPVCRGLPWPAATVHPHAREVAQETVRTKRHFSAGGHALPFVIY